MENNNIISGEWQLCPMCNGFKECPPNNGGISFTSYIPCPLCNAEGKILRPDYANEIRKANADLSYSLGKKYGYPDCCILEYCNDIINNQNPSDRNINGSGFIPCKLHYNQIKSGAITIESLVNFSLEEENKRLKFMIDNGLGWEDMKNDITYPIS